jgi:PTS system nitrogen regulatory IIA component
MLISDFLAPTDVLVDVQATDKTRLLKRSQQPRRDGTWMSGGSIAAELLRREELGSTGIGEGVALPHARIDRIDRPYGVLARLHRPVAFNAVDGMPVDLVFILLTPEAGPAGSSIRWRQSPAGCAMAPRLRRCAWHRPPAHSINY